MTNKSDPSPKKTPAKSHSPSSGDRYELSGDFRGAVVNIKSTIVSNAEVKDLENLPPEPGEPPFQGLQYFDEKDADRFFGRELLIAKIIGRLSTTRFLTVIGASGSGKSSIVRAGVIPALRRGERLGDGSLPPTDSGQWDIRILTPSAHPLEALAASLTIDSESVSAMTTLRADLAENPKALALVARRVLAQNSKKHLLLVIDQFEEIFTQCRQDDERRAFIDNLLHAVDPADPQPVTVLLTLRADFYTQLAFQDHLRELVSQNQEFIGAMNRNELMRAILQPAALGNWKVQEGLVEVILDDLGSEPGALPLLSHALLETWKRRRGRVLTVSGYTTAGGVRGAIAQTAETVFHQRLSADQQPIARMIFIKLAEMGEDSLDTRRRAAFSELITRATDTITIDAVLSILTDARLVTMGTLEPGQTRVVEVAHEALIREWPTLRDWLNQNRQGLILRRQLTEDTNDWLKLGRDPGALYRGVRLKQTLEWVKENVDLISLTEQEFLDASQKTARQEAGQARSLVGARWTQALVAVGILLAAIFTAYNLFAPRIMPDGIFNIAVAEFGEMDAKGEIHASEAGKNLSGWAANYLRDELKKEDSNLVVWPRQDDNLLTRTGVPLVTPNTAEKTAAEMNADLLLYGYIDTRTKPAQLVLNFWITPQNTFKFEDIQGNTQIGQIIRIVDLNKPGIAVQSELKNQSIAIAFIAMGLAQEQLGQAQDALTAFLKAEKGVPQSKEVKFFIGREYLFLSDSQPDQQKKTYWQNAENSLRQAVAFDDQYARAYIGLGSLYMKRSASLMNAALDANQPIDAQTAQQVEQAIQTYQKVLDLKPDSEKYGFPVADIARLALGNAYRLRSGVFYYQGDQASAQLSIEQAIQMIETVRPVFEESTHQHESYRRYLTQTYEHLGEVYQWQGYIYEFVPNRLKALDSYKNSLKYYDECIKQSDHTQDLIIQNDIVGKFCRPYYDQTKESYDMLSNGGS